MHNYCQCALNFNERGKDKFSDLEYECVRSGEERTAKGQKSQVIKEAADRRDE